MVARRRRAHWTDGLLALDPCSISEAFKKRAGVDPRTDDRVLRATRPSWPQAPPGTRPRGRPKDASWKSCVMATVELVCRLQGTRRHDFIAVTLAMMVPGGWGPRGWNMPFNRTPERIRQDMKLLRERIEEAYRRREPGFPITFPWTFDAAGIKPLRKRIKPPAS
jgi:hypothetical protein